MPPNDKIEHHHYIPQYLLKEFLKYPDMKDGKLQIFYKKTASFHALPPRKIFSEENLYRIHEPERDQPPNSAEKEISKIESQTAPVFKSTLKAIRNGNLDMTSSDKEKFILFLANLWARNPTVMNEIREVYERIRFPHLKSAGPLPSQEELDRIFDDNIRIPTAAGWYGDGWKAMIAGIGCIFLHINNFPNKQFVIGNRVVTTIHAPRITRLGCVELSPIAPDIAVLRAGTPRGEGVWGIASSVPDRFVDLVNQTTFQQSQIIASRSKHILQELRDMPLIKFKDIGLDFRMVRRDGDTESI